MSSVHQSQYEKAIDQLEQIVEADPNFDYQHEEDFVHEMSESNHSSLTTSLANRIRRLYKKYVLAESDESLESDEED